MMNLILNSTSKKLATINVVWLIGLLLFIFSLTAYSQDNNTLKTNKKLNDIQRAIDKQKQTLKNTTVKISDLQQQLKADDIAIGKTVKVLSQTNTKLSATRQKIATLSKEKKQIESAKKQQEQILAKQLRAAYSTGHHDYLKLLLNQKDPASVQRTITHYQYLNKARINEIESFKTTIDKLVAVTAQHQTQVSQLNELKQKHSEEKQLFELKKTKRKQTLTALNSKRLTEKQKLAKLEQEENALVNLLKRMAEQARAQAKYREEEQVKAEKSARAIVNLQGLAKLKRKLSWPVKGKIQHSFGTNKQGYLTWKGVFLSAPLGRQVKTIHNGIILFSDWLKGYGLVSVVDHGDGYMSLYGHNQALLKAVGDRVEAGEPIALVGQSGGQIDSGLYFEIRKSGKAMNPKLWCR